MGAPYTFRRLLGLIATVTICAVGLDRGLALRSGTAFNAVGEREWFAWAYREGFAQPLATAGQYLQKDEPIDLFVGDGYFDEGWWRVMARYYLPTHDAHAVRWVDREQVVPRGRTLVLVRDRVVRIIR